MNHWKMAKGAALAWGLTLSIVGVPGQDAMAAQKAAEAASGQETAPPLNVKIRPAQVTGVPAATSAREPVLLPVAIEEGAGSARAGKSAPVRAYARDGVSFYQNGQLIRIQGLVEAEGSAEHAKQRLQQLLDGGQLSVLPVGGTTAGEMLAVVKVNGRDVAEALGNN